MRVTPRRGVTALALAVAVLASGCTASGHSANPPVPSPPAPSSVASSSVASSSVASGGAARYSAAAAEIQAYLDMWVEAGPSAAAARYLVPEEQSSVCESAQWPPISDGPCGDVPVLLSGKVESYQLRSWTSSDNFTLDVTMNLHFRGDPTRWNMNEGVNGRFFTFTRPSAASPYRMYEATGP